MHYLVLISITFISLCSFSFDSCVKRDLKVDIASKKAFGFIDYKLNLEKKRCVIEIQRENFFKSAWKIDICKEPIHLKVLEYFTNKNYIIEKKCSDESEDTFCKKKRQLISIMEKELLINSEGEKENLDSHYGISYCIYELLKKYLNEGMIFSMNQDYSSLKSQNIQPVHQQEKVIQPIGQQEKKQADIPVGENIKEVTTTTTNVEIINKIEEKIKVKAQAMEKDKEKTFEQGVDSNPVKDADLDKFVPTEDELKEGPNVIEKINSF